jgi:catechol 2,3-dioxygenase-like lactoylglutathione lyase family enzyme
MKLNHLHINVPDVAKARRFYEEYFDFTLAFDHAPGVFLKDEAGFMLAIDPLENTERVDFPSWYHFGFSIDSGAKVKATYEKMKANGVEFARDYREFGDVAANFYCWAPGPYKLEVSWNKEG